MSKLSMSKLAKIIFTLSLILNVLFLGLVAGRVYHEANRQRPWDKTKEALAPETREVLKTTFKEKKKEIIPLFKDVHKKKEAMKAIIIAPEFDGEAYDALVGEFKELNSKFMEHRSATIKSIFLQLPQEERAKMAHHTVERMLGNFRHRGKDRRTFRQKTGRFDSERIHKRGAIESAPGKEPFSVRKVQEAETNQAE
ncbi:MAG: periplasmic heavy metal sensor [Alphaproteobacteria bacterium]|nr:periplasmic heavy metal sensor [Alphaproteobacteria bacterium]